MSKKHLIKLADAVRNMGTHDDGETVNKSEVIRALADFCQAENPRFMRGRWLSYIAGECGPCGGRVKRAA